MAIVMTVGGLLVTVVVVGFALWSVFKIFGGLGKANAERERLLREGVQARAQLLAVQMGGMTMTVGVHRHLQLQLQLQVQMPGRPPYQTMLTTMVSELQIPQLQPGAMLTVRVDPRDGNKVALEGVGAPGGYGAPAAMGAPGGYGAPAGFGSQAGYGVPPAGYGGPAYGAPTGFGGAPSGYGGPPGTMPLGGMPAIPARAKVGLWIGVGGAVLGVMVAIVMVMVNVVGVGLGSAGTGDGVCAQAVRCCEAAAGKNGSAEHCKNLGKIGVPVSACEQSLQSFREAARVQGRSCP